MRGVNVLVTGGAGFIGSHLVDALEAAGREVRILDSFATGRLENLGPSAHRRDIVKGDVRIPGDCERAVRGCEAVFHLAALPSVARSLEDPPGSHAVNATGTVNLLDSARARGVRRFIYASSSSIYGNAPAQPKREDQAPEPLSPYAASKLSGELYGRAFASSLGVEFVALRLFNVFGPRQDPDSPYAAVVPIFLRGLLAGEAPEICGDGEQTRDFTYVENVTDAFLRAAEAPADRVNGRVFNVACGGRTSVNALYAALQELEGSKLPARHGPARPGEVRHSQADITLARQALGWEPKVGLKEGLARTVEAARRAAQAT